MDEKERAKVAQALLNAADQLEGKEVDAFGRIGEGRSVSEAAADAEKLRRHASGLKNALQNHKLQAAHQHLGEIDSLLRMIRHALS